MTRALALALLLCGALTPQEDLSKKIDEIVPRLSDDSIDVRDRAVQSLVDLGPAALPLLRKRAAELGAETQGRLLEACGRIESRNTLAKYLPVLKKVTLEWENKPAREAFDEIARRTGLALDTGNAGADGAISFSLKDATPLEAVDEVCRRAGLTWRTVDDDFFVGRRRAAIIKGSPRMLIQNGKAVEYPGTYIRHYRVRVTQVSLTRTNNFQANQSNAQMNLDLGWAPDVKPDGLQSFKITEIKDDQGRSLLVEENDRARGRFRGMRSRYRGRDMGAYSQYLTFKFPEADAKNIAVLKGTAVFSFPQEVKTISFEKPSESQGKSVELNGLTITLKEYQEKGTGHSLTLEMSGKYQGPRDAEAGDDEDFSNLPFSYEDVELVTEGGEPLRHQGMSGRGDGKTYTWQLEYEGEKAAAAKEIRIFCVLRRFSDEAAFEIKDIALPR
jgi:hypothetical protein